MHIVRLHTFSALFLQCLGTFEIKRKHVYKVCADSQTLQSCKISNVCCLAQDSGLYHPHILLKYRQAQSDIICLKGLTSPQKCDSGVESVPGVVVKSHQGRVKLLE